MVKTNADGPVILLAKAQELAKEGARLFVVRMEVAGVDTNLFHYRNHGHGYLRGEVNIGHQRGLDAVFPQATTNLGQVLDIGHGGDGDADELGAGGGQLAALGHCGFHVRGMGVAHGLDHNGVAASNIDGIAYTDRPGFQYRIHTIGFSLGPPSCGPVS